MWSERVRVLFISCYKPGRTGQNNRLNQPNYINCKGILVVVIVIIIIWTLWLAFMSFKGRPRESNGKKQSGNSRLEYSQSSWIRRIFRAFYVLRIWFSYSNAEKKLMFRKLFSLSRKFKTSQREKNAKLDGPLIKRLPVLCSLELTCLTMLKLYESAWIHANSCEEEPTSETETRNQMMKGFTQEEGRKQKRDSRMWNRKIQANSTGKLNPRIPFRKPTNLVVFHVKTLRKKARKIQGFQQQKTLHFQDNFHQSSSAQESLELGINCTQKPA